MEDNHSGYGNRRRVLLAEGGLKWQPVSANFKDMEFSTLKGMTREDICAAFGVPPAEIGFYEDSNYAHADAASSSFWLKTILPRAVWIAEEWDQGVLSRFDGDRSLAFDNASRAMMSTRERSCPGHRRAAKAAQRSRRRFYAWFDSSAVPAVQKAQLALVEMGAKWNQIGVPMNDILRATDAPFEERPWGETWHKPIGLVDVQEEGALFDDLPAPGSDGDAVALPEADDSTERGIEARTSEATKLKLWEAWRLSLAWA